VAHEGHDKTRRRPCCGRGLPQRTEIGGPVLPPSKYAGNPLQRDANHTHAACRRSTLRGRDPVRIGLFAVGQLVSALRQCQVVTRPPVGIRVRKFAHGPHAHTLGGGGVRPGGCESPPPYRRWIGAFGWGAAWNRVVPHGHERQCGRCPGARGGMGFDRISKPERRHWMKCLPAGVPEGTDWSVRSIKMWVGWPMMYRPFGVVARGQGQYLEVRGPYRVAEVLYHSFSLVDYY